MIPTSSDIRLLANTVGEVNSPLNFSPIKSIWF